MPQAGCQDRISEGAVRRERICRRRSAQWPRGPDPAPRARLRENMAQIPPLFGIMRTRPAPVTLPEEERLAGRQVLQPVLDPVELRGQLSDLGLRFPVHREVELAPQPVLRVLAVLAHHDDRGLDRGEHR